jgi:hypothetical protein
MRKRSPIKSNNKVVGLLLAERGFNPRTFGLWAQHANHCATLLLHSRARRCVPDDNNSRGFFAQWLRSLAHNPKVRGSKPFAAESRSATLLLPLIGLKPHARTGCVLCVRFSLQPKWRLDASITIAILAPTEALPLARQTMRKTTPKGFEPSRAEPNGFLVHLLNHSDTVSLAKCKKLIIHSGINVRDDFSGLAPWPSGLCVCALSKEKPALGGFQLAGLWIDFP